jgi:hypothetical protein
LNEPTHPAAFGHSTSINQSTRVPAIVHAERADAPGRLQSLDENGGGAPGCVQPFDVNGGGARGCVQPLDLNDPKQPGASFRSM